MRRLFWIVCLLCAAGARGQEVSETDVQVYAEFWLQGNPLVLQCRQVQGRGREVGGIEPLAVDPALPSFYLVHLTPEGFLVMSSDRRLRPVVYFALSRSLDLSNPAGNALYQLLLAHARTNAEVLAMAGPAPDAWDASTSLQILSDQGAPVIGPLLATSWSQGNHYNEFCPPAANAPGSSAGRAPTGCAATAFAQIFKYHEWPYRGVGSFAYEDTSGAITGTHAAVFSDPYDWAHMQNEYYAFGQEPSEAVQAVSELMYELGVAAEMNYEANASEASFAKLGSRVRQYFRYETPVFTKEAEAASFAGALLGDLAAKRPCLASIPGHGVVIDGHLRQGGDDFFHVNHGWAGNNDGWCLLSDVQGQAIVEIGTGIEPLLTAIPLDSERTAQGWELRWVLPKTRAEEATRIDVLERTLQAGTFTDQAEAFDEFAITSTSSNQDWGLSPAGYTGTCFYKPAGGYLNREYHLTSTRVFRPGPATALVFASHYMLGQDGFSVLVSTNDGDSFTPVWAVTNERKTAWTQIQVPLGGFAGQDIQIRFAYTPGPYYPGGGVWLDEVRLTAMEWYEWNAIRQVQPLEAYRAVSTVTFQDNADTFTTFQVAATGVQPGWSLSAEGRSGNCFYKATGPGSAKYPLTSTRTFRPGPDTQLVFQTRYALAKDRLQASVSAGASSFAVVWSATDTIRENWTAVRVPLGDFAGRDLAIRFEYVPGAYYPNRGVWIDDIQLVDVTGIEYLACPIYHTLLMPLSPGAHVLAYQVWAGGQPQSRSESFTLDAVP